MEQLDPHRTDFHGIRCLSINRKSFEKIPVPLNRDKNNGTLLDVFTFMIIPRWIPLSMRSVSDNTVKKIKIRVSDSTTLLFRKSYRLWNNVEKCGGAKEATDDKIIRRMSFARCVKLHARGHTRAHTHTDQYVILIAFPRQQWFRERASTLCYTYTACLVFVQEVKK